MSTSTGQIVGYTWVELPGDSVGIPDVLIEIGPWLRGLTAVNVSWDSGQMLELAPLPPEWSVHDKYVVSPPIDDALLAEWPCSLANSGRYDEWYFFRAVPEGLQLQPFCNWLGMSLARVSTLAYPGGFDLGAQLDGLLSSLVYET
jgi:hypothetical protein